MEYCNIIENSGRWTTIGLQALCCVTPLERGVPKITTRGKITLFNPNPPPQGLKASSLRISVSCLEKKVCQNNWHEHVCDSAYLTNYNISYPEMRFCLLVDSLVYLISTNWQKFETFKLSTKRFLTHLIIIMVLVVSTICVKESFFLPHERLVVVLILCLQKKKTKTKLKISGWSSCLGKPPRWASYSNATKLHVALFLTQNVHEFKYVFEWCPIGHYSSILNEFAYFSNHHLNPILIFHYL